MAGRKKVKPLRDDATVEMSKKQRHETSTEKTKESEGGSTMSASQSTQVTRSLRGPTQMHRLAMQRVKGVKLDVELNALGQAIGPNVADLQSYIGVLARRKVNITYKTWRHVPEDVKEKIWDAVNLSFNVPPLFKKECVKSANNKWRQHKSSLTEYISDTLKAKGNVHNPPPGSGIVADDWSQFVISRMSEDFQKLSDQQKQRRKLNKYPYRLSRKGYARLAEEIADELGDDEEINRAILWRKGVTNKKGEIEGELLKATMAKIETYIQQKKEGLLKHKGDKEDILTMALESAEHGGRVRAIGGHVNPTTYFAIGRGKKTIDRDFYLEQQAKFESRIAKLEAILKQKGVSSEFEIEEKGSCMYHRSEDEIQPRGNNTCDDADDDEDEDDDDDVQMINREETFEGKRVGLILESETNVIVAYGTVVSVTSKLPDCICVAIDQALIGKALLPFPISSSCETIGDAVGSHVNWPVKLIKLQGEVQLKDKKQGRNKFPHKKDKIELDKSTVPTSLWLLYKYYDCILRDGYGIEICLDKDVFGKSLPSGEVTLAVHEEHVLEVGQLKPCSWTCIVVYVWYLYQKMKEKNKLNKFRFMHPYNIGHYPSRRQDKEFKDEQLESRAKSLADRLGEIFPDEILLVPCNVGWHWILTVIDIEKEIVYLLDPLGPCHRSDDWKHVVETAMKKFKTKGKNGKNGKTNWKLVKAPRQPDSSQCGFYVMAYMKQIIEDAYIDTGSIPTIFAEADYSEKDIDQVRAEWADCLSDLMV